MNAQFFGGTCGAGGEWVLVILDWGRECGCDVIGRHGGQETVADQAVKLQNHEVEDERTVRFKPG